LRHGFILGDKENVKNHLDKQVEKLRAKEVPGTTVNELDWYRDRVKELQEEVSRLRGALEWYAYSNNWEWTTHKSTFDGCGCTDLYSIKCPYDGPVQVGGKRAKEALNHTGDGK
jgi:hypothetical protein